MGGARCEQAKGLTRGPDQGSIKFKLFQIWFKLDLIQIGLFGAKKIEIKMVEKDLMRGTTFLIGTSSNSKWNLN
jgi:hypothetical protein